MDAIGMGLLLRQMVGVAAMTTIREREIAGSYDNCNGMLRVVLMLILGLMDNIIMMITLTTATISKEEKSHPRPPLAEMAVTYPSTH
jgi:hypothetical protein